MVTQGDRQNYLWRPNDNSSTTRTRYDLEAEHWHKSFKSAELKNRTTSLGDSFSFIGLVVSLMFSLIALIVVCIIDFIKWVRS